ncbi:uncharacterized protein LOC115224402 [Octopus sinensis]|uniref:Uncharacterized protein LOC115224402 n=1 Tax=Octopus sinensis TaxID=2607531 RepID=A0A6P7THU3_9MOLL|nr:uncharacterized protein LOC115224402 [Octopus sinensis]
MDVLMEKRKQCEKLLSRLVVAGQETADSLQDIHKLLRSNRKKILADSKDNYPTVSSYNHAAEISSITSPGYCDKRRAHKTAANRENISFEKPLCNHLESSPVRVFKSLYDGGNKCFDSSSALLTTGFFDDIHSVSVGADEDAVLFDDYEKAKDKVDDATSWDIPKEETNVCEIGMGGDIAIDNADGQLVCDDEIDVTDGGDSFFIDYFIGSGDNVDDDDIVASKFSLENHRLDQFVPVEPPSISPYLNNDELNCRTPNATSKATYPQTPKSQNHHLQITKDKFLEESTKEEHEPRSPLRILCSDNWASQWRNSFTIDNDDSDLQLSDNDLSDSWKLEDRSSSHLNASAEENQMKLHNKILDSSQEGAGKKEEVEDPGTVEIRQYSSQLNDSGNLKKPSRVSVGIKRHSKVGKENICRDAPKSAFKSQKEKLLGYDWIAGILDNRQHHSTTHLSNEHFDKLKSFWKESQDRRLTDVNQLENFVDASHEPQLIQDILTESKIKSYHVNDRLFSEPMKKKSFLTSESSEVNNSRSSAERKPTFSSPRYVRISMPQDLLLTKRQVNKAPRKGTCDTTDTLSLGKHCVMGWNNTQHGKLATASSISIKHASGGRAKETLTMEEAENLAAGTSSLFQMDSGIQHLSQRPADHRLFTAASRGKRQNESSKEPQMPLHQSEPANCDRHNQETFSSFLQNVTNTASTSPVTGHSSRHSSGKTSTLSTSELLDSTYSLIKHLDQLKAKYEKKKLIRQQQLQGMIT